MLLSFSAGGCLLIWIDFNFNEYPESTNKIFTLNRKNEHIKFLVKENRKRLFYAWSVCLRVYYTIKFMVHYVIALYSFFAFVMLFILLVRATFYLSVTRKFVYIFFIFARRYRSIDIYNAKTRAEQQ